MKDFVDFHSHILPGVDHGSHSLNTTLNQLRYAESFGVKKIFATSHFYPNQHSVSSFLQKRNKAYAEIIESGVKIPEIKIGAEVLLCENLHELEGLSDLCIYGTKYILLELPFTSLSQGMIDSVEMLVKRGYNVILAHADRYSPERIEKLLRFGVSLQLNADSLVKFFKNKKLFEWIREGRVVALGSDIHGSDETAYKKFLKAIKKIGVDFEKIAEKSNEIWEKAPRF